MSAGKVFVFLIACFAWVLGPAGCEGCGCSKDGLIATLTSVKGEVTRDHSTSLGQWKLAAIKGRYFLGDGIRTKEKSGAVLNMPGGAELHVKESTQIRFMDEMPKSGGVGVDVESGEAELVAGAEDIEVVLSDDDVAVVHSGGRVRLKRNKNGVDLQVKIGRADVLKSGKTVSELSSGQNIQIEIGAAEVVTSQVSDTTTGQTEADSSNEEMHSSPGGTVQVEVLGEGARVRQSKDESWQDLASGTGTVPEHTRISLPGNVRVKANRKGEKVTLVGPGEFNFGGTDDPLVQTGRGKVLIDSAQQSVTVIVPGGRIVTAVGSSGSTQAQIDTKKDQTHIDVQNGTLEVHTDEGLELLNAGETTTVKPATKQAQPSSYTYDSGPVLADFDVSAGDSFVVHVNKPPVIVGFKIGKSCPGDAVVTIGGKRGGIRGQGVVNVTLRHGRSSYRIYCLNSDGAPEEKAVEKGQVRVLRDSGKARLPKNAPRSMVDLDGRNYKISYQNRLPIVKVRWTRAPEANSYSLSVDSKSKNKSIKSSKPEYTFSSGTLGEGTHQLSFVNTRTGEKSKTTRVQIQFDNAAPKASLSKPEAEGFSSGQTVTISGVAMPGWNVSVAGGQLSMDSAHRFTGEVHYGGKYRGIAIRLVQPGRGVHYYLRRASGTFE